RARRGRPFLRSLLHRHRRPQQLTAEGDDMDSTTLTAPPAATRNRVTVPQRIVEIVSDSGEGAQKAGQTFGTVCAKLGNGVWTVEIIPAEIKPPARSRA